MEGPNCNHPLPAPPARRNTLVPNLGDAVGIATSLLSIKSSAPLKSDSIELIIGTLPRMAMPLPSLTELDCVINSYKRSSLWPFCAWIRDPISKSSP